MAQTASQKLENRIELLSSIRPAKSNLPPVYSVRVKYQHNPCPKATNAALVTASANDYKICFLIICCPSAVKDIAYMKPDIRLCTKHERSENVGAAGQAHAAVLGITTRLQTN